MNRFQRYLFALLSAAFVVVSGCGGGGGGGESVAGIGGTGKTISGVITGFGSIFVNGVEHSLNTASIEVDDKPATENDLRIGMVVTLTSKVSGSTGIADSVVYDNEVEGPVSSIVDGGDGLSRSFQVLGLNVVVDATGTVFDDGVPGFAFATLADNDVVAVSGFLDGSGTLNASYIRKQGTFPGLSQVEVKGVVSNAGAGAGPGDSFLLNGITVMLSTGIDLSEVPGMLVTNGLFVEAKGTLATPSLINADVVEVESQSIGDDGDSVSLEGVVSGFSGDLASFQVAGQAVDASSASLVPTGLQITNGNRVEVEGELSGSVLVATRVESRSSEIKVHATVGSISVTNATSNEGSITLNLAGDTLLLQTDNRTTLEDETGADTSEPLKLDELASGDFLELSGFQNGSSVTATEIHRKFPEDVILQGPVESVVSGSSVTILGITFSTDGSTQFEDTGDNPLAGGSTTFYSVDRTGDRVRIRDAQPGDGTAEEVDLES